jgi:hypothetical protein
MRAEGQTSVWRAPIGRARNAKHWYQQVHAWWTAHNAARYAAHLATVTARWDARREVVHPLPADAARDMVASTRACSTIMAFCNLAV